MCVNKVSNFLYFFLSFPHFGLVLFFVFSSFNRCARNVGGQLTVPTTTERIGELLAACLLLKVGRSILLVDTAFLTIDEQLVLARVSGGEKLCDITKRMNLVL